MHVGAFLCALHMSTTGDCHHCCWCLVFAVAMTTECLWGVSFSVMGTDHLPESCGYCTVGIEISAAARPLPSTSLCLCQKVQLCPNAQTLSVCPEKRGGARTCSPRSRPVLRAALPVTSGHAATMSSPLIFLQSPLHTTYLGFPLDLGGPPVAFLVITLVIIVAPASIFEPGVAAGACEYR